VSKLFRVAGLDGDALGFDSWTHVLRVHDADGIRASPIWIQRDALMGFPVAIDGSSLAAEKRVKVMKEFADRWFAAFSSWPGFSPRYSQPPGYPISPFRDSNNRLFNQAFRSKVTLENLKQVDSNDADPKGDFRFELILRRLLVANPELGPTLVNEAPKPSQEFLLLWAQTDTGGMIRWAESLDAKDRELAVRAKALLMSFVDLETRERWLNEAEQSHPVDETLNTLMLGWAEWDLEGALLAATKLPHPEAAMSLANSGVYGPFVGQPWNSSRFAIQVLTRLDYSKIPDAVQEKVFEDAYSLMEQWDSMDVAGAARFGLAYLLRTNYAPRERLIRFFAGDNIYGGEDGMIDRTFCALRIWAVVRPAEMKAWIATLNDSELQKSLAWLLRHPWGKAPDEKKQGR